jgi:hypothetical protein
MEIMVVRTRRSREGEIGSLKSTVSMGCREGGEGTYGVRGMVVRGLLEG